MHSTAITLLAACLVIGAIPAQERLFQTGDLAIRREVAAGLDRVMGLCADLPTTVALAAVTGVALPAGSRAALQLTEALRTANADSDAGSATRRLRSDLGDLIAVLSFEPYVEAKLPEGFPGFGAVDEIELREYPKYRMARTEMSRGSHSAFWPLFQHIQNNDIAMTTPVQMDWKDGSPSSRPANMAFLYGNLAIATGTTGKGIEVVEVPAQTVLTIGAIGTDRPAIVEEMRARLQAFLCAPGSVLVACGPMRTMHYNSPTVSSDRRCFEVQIPVRSRSF